MRLWKRGLYLTCEKREQSGHSSEVWQLNSPICYHVNTSQQPTLASSSVPPHLPDAPPLKGWKVGRCLREQQGASGVRFLWGQVLSVFWVEGAGLERGDGGLGVVAIWLVSSAGDRRDHRAAVLPHQLHLWPPTDSHSCMRQSQSAFMVLPTTRCKSIILESFALLHFEHKVNDNKYTVHLSALNPKL